MSLGCFDHDSYHISSLPSSQAEIGSFMLMQSSAAVEPRQIPTGRRSKSGKPVLIRQYTKTVSLVSLQSFLFYVVTH